VRDVRDYRIHQSDGEIITGGSCFNVKAASLRLGDFTQEDVRALYGQHTAATGQVFEEDVFPLVWELTHGQPWLVNALAHEATYNIKENRDRGVPITAGKIREAANAIILRRETHLDQLAFRLEDERVRRIIIPMLAGAEGGDAQLEGVNPDDIQYVIDLGLIRRENGRRLVISNGIYREIIPRELTYVLNERLYADVEQKWYLAPDGRIDMDKLLGGFAQFFRENADSYTDNHGYKEAVFQLLVQAYLHRIINGGGQLEREYALGRGRVDLFLRYWYPETAPRPARKEQRVALELKTIRPKGKGARQVLEEGLEQTYGYAQRGAPESAHLIICDQTGTKAWDERIYRRVENYKGMEITVWGV
jgi:hypothetical protein